MSAEREKGTGKTAPLILRFKKNEAGVEVPAYESSGAAGLDLRAFIGSEITLPPLGRAKIPTGLFLELPEGCEAQVRPRSGLADKYGVTVLNSPGTIDSDFRGEVNVILINLGKEPFTVKNGERIAQMVISPFIRVSVCEAEFLQQTERGSGGFGSTGV